MKRQDDRNYVGNDADGFVPKITVRADGAKKQADDLVYQGSLQDGLTPVVALEGAAVLTNVLGYVEDINAVVTPSEGDKYLSKDDGDYVLAYWNGTEWLLTIAMEAEKFTWIDEGVYYEVIIKDNTKYQISPVAIDIEEQLATKVSKTGAETIEGIKTFASSPLVPTPTSDMQAATKKYADDILSSFSGDLIGAIGYDAEAPTPGMTGKYVFSSAGLCTWMTGGAVQVDVGDEVLVLFTEPDIYAYTHLKLSQSYTSEIYRLEEEIAQLAGDVSDKVNKLPTQYLSNSFSDTGINIPLEGSIEIVFHLDELKVGTQIINSNNRNPFLVLSSPTRLYTKIGNTYFYDLITDLDVNSQINIKMVWSASNMTIFANGEEVVNQGYEGTTNGTLVFSNSEDLKTFKGVIYKCIMKNSNGEILYNGSGFSTGTNVELYNKLKPLISEIVGWATSESYSASNIIFDSKGIISSADIKWADGDEGSISNVTTNNDGITSIRYNRSNGDYVLMSITYNVNGTIKSQETEYITI